MDYLEFEYPMPVLALDAEKLVIETAGGYDGEFTITNHGGGTLTGNIIEKSGMLRLSAESFSGNETRVKFSVPEINHKINEVLNTEIIVSTNGGEKIIPVIIRGLPNFLTTRDGLKISELKEFASYAKKNPSAARALFYSQEFMFWLFNGGYEQMELYDRLVKDSNKERALDNFLVINKLKNKSYLEFSDGHLEFSLPPVKSAARREIIVKKIGWGYASENLSLLEPKPWINFYPDRLSTESFDENGTARVMLELNASRLSGLYDEAVLCAGQASIKLGVKRLPFLSATLSKESYSTDDVGKLCVVNNSGADVLVEIETGDGFIKFEGKKYLVGKEADIPFVVRLTAIQLAQLALSKRPLIESFISVKANLASKIVKKNISLRVFASL